MEDALGQTSHQLHSFQENFEKVLPPPTTQVSVPPSPSKTIHSFTCQWGEVSPQFPSPFFSQLFPVTQETHCLSLSLFCDLGVGVGWKSLSLSLFLSLYLSHTHILFMVDKYKSRLRR